MRRKLALLGGTTTNADALVAAALGLRGAEAPAVRLDEYEEAFARSVGTAHAAAFATARVGLYGLLRALAVGEGDEVLLPAPTHIVVANAVRYTGATPVYADCRAEDWNIDLDSAAQRVGPRTRAIVAQHSFGIPVDMDAVGRFAAEHDLAVLEDCVHALGARWRERPAGSLGRAAFFSTEETKMISTTMGGMVVTDDGELHRRMLEFRRTCAPPSRGLTARYLLKLVAYHLLTQPVAHRFTRAGYEALGERQPLPTPTERAELEGGMRSDYRQRLAPAQAVLALRQLGRLDANVAHRRRIAAIYRRLLEPAGLRLAQVPAGAEPSWVRFPVHVPDRAVAVEALRPHAVAGTWFSSVLEEAATPASGGYPAGSCPRAEEASQHLVNLPTHPRVRPDDAERIARALTCAVS